MVIIIRNAASWIDKTLGWFFTNGNKVGYDVFQAIEDRD